MNIQHILRTVISFILDLYAADSYPRKIVQEFVDFIRNFIQSVFIPSIKQDVLLALKSHNVSESCLREVSRCIDQYNNILKAISTERKRFDI